MKTKLTLEKITDDEELDRLEDLARETARIGKNYISLQYIPEEDYTFAQSSIITCILEETMYIIHSDPFEEDVWYKVITRHTEES